MLQSATITEASANSFKKEIMTPIKIIRDLQYVLIAVGAAIIVALVIALFVKIRKEKVGFCYLHFLENFEKLYFA